MLFSFPFDHALHQAVHVADGRRENVDAGGGDEFFRFVGSGAEFGQVRRGCVNFGAGADVADFAFNQNVGIDGFQFLHGVAGLAYVFVERQRGKIEDDGIEAGVRGFERFGQRMGVISVQVDRKSNSSRRLFTTAATWRTPRKARSPSDTPTKTGTRSSRAAAKTPVRILSSPMLKCPTATLFFCACSKTSRSFCMGILLDRR